eukprot:3726706-Pyramimonas_sp.AAC.1
MVLDIGRGSPQGVGPSFKRPFKCAPGRNDGVKQCHRSAKRGSHERSSAQAPVSRLPAPVGK